VYTKTVGTVSHRIDEDHGGYIVHNPYLKHFDECYKNLKEKRDLEEQTNTKYVRKKDIQKEYAYVHEEMDLVSLRKCVLVKK